MRNLVWFTCLFFMSCNSEEDSQLVNKWKLSSYLKNSSSLVVNIQKDIYFEFKTGESFSVDLDVNNGSGSYTNGTKDISISKPELTKICCDSEEALEALELATDSVTHFSITGTQLKLKGEHETVLFFNLVQ